MEKLIRLGLVVVCVNVVVGFLAGTAFFFYIFRSDPILAAIPVVLALPGILAQPWYVLFLFLQWEPPFAPVLTTLVSVLFYSALDRIGKLEWAKLVLTRFKKIRVARIALVVFFFALAIGVARYFDFPVLRHGVPDGLSLLTKDLDLTLTDPRYYCLVSFVDSEWLWQAELPEADLDRLAGRIRLHPLDADKIGDGFFRMSPYWWHPVISKQTRVLATTDFPMKDRGQDGLHVLATWNPEDEVLHLWIKSNM